MPARSIAQAPSATSLIQTAEPGRFLALVLAAGVGLADFTPDRPSVPSPTLRLIAGGRDAA
jgi:hypothetical protein